MTTQTQTPASNRDAIMKAIDAKITKLARDEVDGAAARPKFARMLCEAAAVGDLDEDDAAHCYQTYLNAQATRARGNLNVREPNKDSLKAQASKFRTFIKLGKLEGIIDVVGPAGLYPRAERIADDLSRAGVKVQSPFAAILTVATRQLENPEAALTDEQIAGYVTKDEPAEKSLLEKLCREYKTISKLIDEAAGGAAPQGLTYALQGIADAIVELDGEVPMTKEQEANAKKVAEAMAFLQAQGMAVTC